MSLNDISLSPFVTASLYRSSLIINESNEPIVKPLPVGPDTEKGWKYLGNNRKNILLAVNYTDVTHLPDEELGFLTTILSACKLDLGDVAIININNYPQHTYKDFIGHFSSRIILLFGIDPISFGLPVDFPQFQVQPVANTTFLYSPAPGERNSDPLFKSKLWVCLKRIFGV